MTKVLEAEGVELTLCQFFDSFRKRAVKIGKVTEVRNKNCVRFEHDRREFGITSSGAVRWNVFSAPRRVANDLIDRSLRVRFENSFGRNENRRVFRDFEELEGQRPTVRSDTLLLVELLYKGRLWLF